MAMVPLDPMAIRSLRSWLGEPPGPGLLALHHALAYQRPGLWGDHARLPRSVVLVREGDDQLEAFGAGEPEPSAGWLAGLGRPVSLAAPAAWRDALTARMGAIDQTAMQTWTIDPFELAMTAILDEPLSSSGVGPAAAAGAMASSSSSASASTSPTASTSAVAGVAIRRLGAGDASAFAAIAPGWALRGWGSYAALIAFGAGFGVPFGSGFASLAWIYDQSAGYDAIGVFTIPRYRRLGLGKAAAGALVRHIARRRGKIPLWSTPPDNDSSISLARALGFSTQANEPLFRWPPRPQIAQKPSEAAS